MMLSMTGFARETLKTATHELHCEIRTVNHRHVEAFLKLPETLRDLDPLIREQLRQYVNRGKIDVTMTLQTVAAPEGLKLNTGMVEQLLAASRHLTDLDASVAALSAMDILRWPGVLQAEESNLDQLRQEVLVLLAEALKKLNETRAREGEKIQEMLNQRLHQTRGFIQQVRAILPEIQKAYLAKVQHKCAEAQLTLDPMRLEQEMLLMIQRSDVSEELDRLDAHCLEMERVLKEGGVIGRRLDFLMQEFNREANTLGSKSMAVDTTKISVELKVLIEQMREQIQNVE